MSLFRRTTLILGHVALSFILKAVDWLKSTNMLSYEVVEARFRRVRISLYLELSCLYREYHSYLVFKYTPVELKLKILLSTYAYVLNSNLFERTYFPCIS
jgi:hypothetical protein